MSDRTPISVLRERREGALALLKSFGSTWIHEKSGGVYVLLDVVTAEEIIDHPRALRVIYDSKDQMGSKFARPLPEFLTKFRPVPD